MFTINDICAGIVLYNPDIVRLTENLNSITMQCVKVLLVDNHSVNINDIRNLIKLFDNVDLYCFDENQGIARALNQIINYANCNGYKWALTLDQDSVCKKELLANYINFINLHDFINIGCITCCIEDRNFENKKNIDEYKFVDYCITSGSLMNVYATLDSGGFDNKMFIDKVDTDICIALCKCNYKIVQIEYIGLLHEVGHAKQINLGFRKWEMYNHNSLRRYYMCRNASYLLKKYKNVYVVKIFIKEIFQTLLVILFEKRKGEKLIMGLKGFINGFFEDDKL